jgi:magnesium and cobalt exporter, CNNM family
MIDTEVLNWFALALCVGLSFLLSGMEAGVFALSRLHVRRLARAGKPSAKLLNRFLDNPEKLLWTILVGNTLANFFILGFALLKIHDWLPGRHILVALVFFALVFLFYVLFDLLPKMLFRAFPDQLCMRSARFFRWISVPLSPLVSLVEGVSNTLLRLTGGRAFTGRLFGSRDEMRAVMRESAPSAAEHTMINRVLDLQHFTVRQITVPLAQIVTVNAATPLAEALNLAREKKFSRLPVREEGNRRIAGLLMLGPILFRTDVDLQKPSSAYMTPALFFNEDLRLEDALRRLQRAGERLAVVLGRDGKEIGVVSLEDILKVIFGEMKL